jgi:hypothetical protein
MINRAYNINIGVPMKLFNKVHSVRGIRVCPTRDNVVSNSMFRIKSKNKTSDDFPFDF